MPRFSPQSLTAYDTLHPDLQRVCDAAIRVTDFSILCGHRDEVAQELAYLRGASKLHWPHSRHNTSPSSAMDLVPYPLDWDDSRSFHALAGVILTIAEQLGVGLVWGGNWAMKDLPHYELAG